MHSQGSTAAIEAGARGLGVASPAAWCEDPDVDDLGEHLRGLPPAEAERQVRAALRSSNGEASEADTLAVLLKVFRLARDDALEGYVSWDIPVVYCNRLTRICDENFVGATGGEPAGASDFPASAVAAIYAECGRTLALADLLPAARDRLQKALNVFSIVPGGAEDAVRYQTADAGASMARVLRRLGRPEEAQTQYLKALEIYAELPTTDVLADFITEYCEVLGEAGRDMLSPTIPPLLAQLAEEKLGRGSDVHLKVLKDIADLCTGIGQPGLAGPVLATRARLLRAHGSGIACSHRQSRRRPDALAEAEAEAAEEEAAEALEATVATNLQEGNLTVAADMWAEALHFRELLEPPGSSLILEMRQSLSALQQAIACQTGASELLEHAQDPDELEQAQGQEDLSLIRQVDTQGDCMAAVTADVHPPARTPTSRLRPSWTQESGLRPGWASRPCQRPADDGWDD